PRRTARAATGSSWLVLAREHDGADQRSQEQEGDRLERKDEAAKDGCSNCSRGPVHRLDSRITPVERVLDQKDQSTQHAQRHEQREPSLLVVESLSTDR